MKLLVVSSAGGHLTDLLTLLEGAAGIEPVWVVNDASPVLPPDGVRYRIRHAARGPALLWNLLELARIFAVERPQALLSAGASPAVPAALLARLAGLPVIYVEASCAVTELTLTGKLMRRLATVYFVQWESLLARAPEARYVGGVL